MLFTKAVNVWSTDLDIKSLQPGQWVYAGDRSAGGRFLGVKKSGSIVVAWNENAKRSGGYLGYVRALRNYAKSI